MFPLVAFGILHILCGRTLGNRTWDFELVSVSSNTTDESKMKIDLRIERVSRGETVMSGVWDWQFDVDDDTMFQLKTFSSHNGAADSYKLLPYQISPIKYYDFMDQFYTDIFYRNFIHCIDLPVYINREKTPLPRRTYIVERCVPKGIGLPEILPDSFYKMEFHFTSVFEVYFSLVGKVYTKSFMKF